MHYTEIVAGKVYQNKYFDDNVVALESCLYNDTFKAFSLVTGKERYVESSSFDEMQEELAIEYLQSEIVHKYPNWIEIVENILQLKEKEEETNEVAEYERYTVRANKVSGKIIGIFEEELSFIEDFSDIPMAEEKAKQLFLIGEYSSIYIEFVHHNAWGYLNPVTGMGSTGLDWVEYFADKN